MTENFVEKYLNETCPICITGEITNEAAVKFQMQIAAKQKQLEDDCVSESERVITVNITDCPGGSVSAGWAMYDVMRSANAKIKVICSGMVASMGVILALAGDKGLREAYPHSEFLLHQPLGGVQGQATDILIHSKHIEKSRLGLYKLISDKTGQPLKKVSKDCERDFILSAQEALEYGIIDEIIPLREEKI